MSVSALARGRCRKCERRVWLRQVGSNDYAGTERTLAWCGRRGGAGAPFTCPEGGRHRAVDHSIEVACLGCGGRTLPVPETGHDLCLTCGDEWPDLTVADVIGERDEIL